MITPKISASQIETYLRCPQKWHLSRQHRQPQHPAAKEGDRIHKQIEMSIVQSGSVSDRYTEEAKKYHESATGKKHTEYSFALPFEDVILVGRIDLLIIDEDLSQIEIIDWKTTGQLTKKMISVDLEKDIQRIVYSYAVHTIFPQINNVRFSIVGICTSTARSDRKTWIASKSETLDKMREIYYDAIIGMYPHEAHERKAEACQDFGGCFFKKTLICDQNFDLVQIQIQKGENAMVKKAHAQTIASTPIPADPEELPQSETPTTRPTTTDALAQIMQRSGVPAKVISQTETVISQNETLSRSPTNTNTEDEIKKKAKAAILALLDLL
jgi:ATP-dependent exoDNAse (exonuclease V) beta subunit